MTTFLVGLGIVAIARRARLAALLPHRPPPEPDVLEVAGLLSVGLHAGLSLPAALLAASDALGPPANAPLLRVVREGRLLGIGHALATTPGVLAELFRRLADAERTGAPLLGTIGAYEREREAEARAELVARARALPVRLAIPLTLLILPGAVLALLGPTVVDLLPAALTP